VEQLILGMHTMSTRFWHKNQVWHILIHLLELRITQGGVLLIVSVDISYAAPHAHGIVNVALYREYSPGIVFIFSQERKDLYHV
jgi:hypothetical protein